MRRLLPVLLSCLLATTSQSVAAQVAEPPGKATTRCAVFYLLMSKIPAVANDKPRLERIVDELLGRAASQGTTTEEQERWAREYILDANSAATAGDKGFNPRQAETCQAILDTMMAERGTPPSPSPEPVGPGDVTARHADGRPAVIAALDHSVRFDDGAGATCAAPVAMLGVTPMAPRVRAQYVWIDAVHPGWTLVKRDTRFDPPSAPGNEESIPDKVYSWFSITDPDGVAFEVCFDITDALRPELDKLRAARPAAGG